MCIQITEHYAVCNCVRHVHAVDACPKAGKKGHAITKKVVQVGYACDSHSKKKDAPEKDSTLYTEQLSSSSVNLVQQDDGSTNSRPNNRRRTNVKQYDSWGTYSGPDDIRKPDIKPNLEENAPTSTSEQYQVYRKDSNNKNSLRNPPGDLAAPQFRRSGIRNEFGEGITRQNDGFILPPRLLVQTGSADSDIHNFEPSKTNAKIKKTSKFNAILPRAEQKNLETGNGSNVQSYRGLLLDPQPMAESFRIEQPITQAPQSSANKRGKDALVNPSQARYSETRKAPSMIIGLQVFLSLQNFRQFGRVLLRPRLQEGWNRIEWICTCGETLYGDYVEASTGSLQELATKLGGRIIAGDLSQNELTDCSEGHGRQECLGMPTQAENAGSESSSKAKSLGVPSRRGSKSVIETVAKVDTQDPTPKPTAKRRWLELCIRAGSDSFSLAEIDLAGIQDDNAVFSKIRDKYHELRRRKRLWSWFFSMPIGGVFVELMKDKLAVGKQAPTVSVLQRNSWPLPEEARDYNYSFCPVPMKMVPMDSRTFYHYFSKPHNAETTAIWMTRFPKLNGSSFYYSQEILGRAWGIEITEDRNWSLLLVFNIIGLLLSGLAAAIFAHYANDNSTGIAIGAWLSAVQGLTAAACFFYWARH